MCMVRRTGAEKERFYDDLRSEWDLHSVLGMGDFNGHVGKRIEGYEGIRGGNGIGKRNVEGKILLEICELKSVHCQILYRIHSLSIFNIIEEVGFFR